MIIHTINHILMYVTYDDVGRRYPQVECKLRFQSSHIKFSHAVIDHQNQTPTPSICARPGSFDQIPTMPPVPDNAQARSAETIFGRAGCSRCLSSPSSRVYCRYIFTAAATSINPAKVILVECTDLFRLSDPSDSIIV